MPLAVENRFFIFYLNWLKVTMNDLVIALVTSDAANQGSKSPRSMEVHR